MVCQDGSRDVKAIDNVIEDELGDLNSSSYDMGDCLKSFSEVMSVYYDTLMSFG